MRKSHDDYGKVVHRLYSSCISSIQKLTGTPSSSSYQFGLGVGSWPEPYTMQQKRFLIPLAILSNFIQLLSYNN